MLYFLSAFIDTLILLGPVSLQFNPADQSKKIEKSRKKCQKYFLDGIFKYSPQAS
jgi:hypothetical protein